MPDLGDLAGWRGADLLADLPAAHEDDAEEVPEEVMCVCKLVNSLLALQAVPVCARPFIRLEQCGGGRVR